MTDRSNHRLLDQDARTNKRNRAEARFKAYGLTAIGIGVLMLLILLTTIIGRGSGAFQQTYLTLEVTLDEAKLDKKGNRDIADIKKVSTFGYKPLLANAFEALVDSGDVTSDLSAKEDGRHPVQRCRGADAQRGDREPRLDRPNSTV